MLAQCKRSDLSRREWFQEFFLLPFATPSLQQICIQTIVNRNDYSGTGTSSGQLLDGHARRKHTEAGTISLFGHSDGH